LPLPACCAAALAAFFVESGRLRVEVFLFFFPNQGMNRIFPPPALLPVLFFQPVLFRNNSNVLGGVSDGVYLDRAEQIRTWTRSASIGKFDRTAGKRMRFGSFSARGRRIQVLSILN
jgi:hypothetical protein